MRRVAGELGALAVEERLLDGDDGRLSLLHPQVLTPDLRQRAAAQFAREVLPVLTPIAIDPGHPFPHLANKSLNVVVRFRAQTRLRFGVVPVPYVLPRLVDLGAGGFLLLEDLIALNVSQLFTEIPVAGCHACRIQRNDHGGAARLEIAASADEELIGELRAQLGLRPEDVHRIEGPLDVPALLRAAEGRPS